MFTEHLLLGSITEIIQYFSSTLHLHLGLEGTHCDKFLFPINLGIDHHIFPVMQSEKVNKFLWVRLSDDSSTSLIPYLWARKEERWAQSYLPGMRCNTLGVSDSSSFPENTTNLSCFLITLAFFEHLPCFRLCAQRFMNMLSFHSTLWGWYYYFHFTGAETEAHRTKLKNAQALWSIDRSVHLNWDWAIFNVSYYPVFTEPNQNSSATLEFESLTNFRNHNKVRKYWEEKCFLFEDFRLHFILLWHGLYLFSKWLFLFLFFLASFIVSFLIMKQNFFSPPCFMW